MKRLYHRLHINSTFTEQKVYMLEKCCALCVLRANCTVLMEENEGLDNAYFAH